MMSRENLNIRTSIKRDFAERHMQYFICPDGNARQLKDFDVKEDHLLLDMVPVQTGSGVDTMKYRWPLATVEDRWSQFSRISQQQALGKTSLSSSSNPVAGRIDEARPTLPQTTEASQPAVPAEVMPDSKLSPVFRSALDQVEELLPMQSVATGLETIFNRLVDSAKPGSRPSQELINTAKAAESLSNRVIDMRKLQLEGIKLLVSKQK